MVLRKISTPNETHQAGFTIIELVIALGIVLMFAGFITLLDFGNYRADALRAETSTIASVLQAARADALNNIDECPHGVRISAQGYILFEGANFADQSCDRSHEQFIAASYALHIDPDPADIVFAQLSAAAEGATITVTDPARPDIGARVIEISSEGGVSW